MGRTRRIAAAASILAVAVGVALVAFGLQEAGRDSPPRYEGAVVQAIGEEPAGEGRAIDWGSLPDSVIAWVYVPGTSIDYPVVSGAGRYPGFYLSHDADGDFSAWGVPYVAAACPEGLDSKLVLVYGHHMSDGSMFADFANFSDAGYASGHDEIVLYTRSETVRLAPAVVDVVNANREAPTLDFAGWEELGEYMGEVSAKGDVAIRGIPEGARVYAFATCSYETANSRTVVYAIEER